MECVSIKRANGGISPPKEDDAAHLGRFPGVSQVPQGEAP